MNSSMTVMVGWVPLGEDGAPYRPIRGRSYYARRKPVTVYQTEEKAKGYSPIGEARRCYMETA